MVKVEHLVKQFQDSGNTVFAVNDISFDVPKGQIITLLGPSGCGKTTTLRSIAGLEKPEGGRIEIGGRVVYDSSQGINLPPNQRKLGMVFQSYAIWPHMTVFENVAFPLRYGVKRLPRRDIQKKVFEALELVALGGYEKRLATKLSGGQQQRVALARAIVWEPDVLLLDEPLSNLDAKLREQMRVELKELQRKLNITSIYVTHDQAEALALSDIVAVFSHGKIVQFGTPHEIYEQPYNTFVADFVGTTNFVPGKVDGRSADGMLVVATESGSLHCRSHLDLAPGAETTICIRPETVELVSEAPGDRTNVLSGRVSGVIFLGEAVEYKVQVGNSAFKVKTQRNLGFAEGNQVYIRVDSQRCVALAG